ncbi:MAG TPA: helix-turn-helix domain-containing protein [Solirubrobacteraceae bacterium]|nr:helix-turn-helix domain-containing protein [Solirubrobacteraceae bacterium]
MTLCHILREDPDLAEAVPAVLRPRATEQCVARTVQVRTGRWSGVGEDVIGTGIGLLVLDGRLLRRVGVEGRFGAELLGEGDLLRPWQGEDASPTLARTTGWRVLEPTRLALLDDAVARRFAEYPELTGRLVARALERARHLAVSMAIIHQARVNIRLHMMLWHLADRWGRVRSEGVFLPLTLTHSLLADIVAARRPTVTSALTELARQDLVRPFPGGWLLLGEPPGELLAVQEVGVAEG